MELTTRTTATAREVEQRPRNKPTPQTFGEKRPCATSGCITRLNRYHEGEHCYACQEKRKALVAQTVEAEEILRRAGSDLIAQIDEWRGRPSNWPLSPNDPCRPAWLTLQYLVERREVWEIASELGCSEQRVHIMLSRLGITSRTAERMAA